MSKPFTIALPPGMILWDGCKVRVTAIDPDTGNTVSGVNVSEVSLEVQQTRGGSLASGIFQPLLIRRVGAGA